MGRLENAIGRQNINSVFCRAFAAALGENENLPIFVSRKTAILTDVQDRAFERGNCLGKKTSYQPGGNQEYLGSYSRSNILRFAL